MSEGTGFGDLGAHGDRVFLRAGDTDLSFVEVDRRACSLAHLLADAGVAHGDRAAVMLTNRPSSSSPCTPSITWAPRSCSSVRPGRRPRSNTPSASRNRCTAWRTGRRCPSSGRCCPSPTSMTSPCRTNRSTGVQGLRDDEAVLVFSSGTTGMPKAVRHTHQCCASPPGNGSTRGAHRCRPVPGDDAAVAHPRASTSSPRDAGATVRLHPRFDLDEVLHRIASERMTLEMVVAPIALAMANHPNLEALDLSSLRFILWGATPVTEVVARSITERTGVRFLAGYGASELPVISVNPVRQPDRWRLDAVGLPVPGVELRVVDLTTGEPLPTGEVGEIQARSPSVMAGYLPDEANAEAFVGDGWYRTGDVGFVEPRAGSTSPTAPRR